MNLNTAVVKSYFKSLIDLAIKLIVNPAEFFRTMPKTGGLLDPMFFLVVTVLLDVLLISFESFVTHGVSVNGLSMMFGGMIIASLIVVILSFFAAGILFAVWSFMGSKENYETSYRCLAYMQAIVPVAILLSLVPYLGLLGIAWWFFLMVTATRVVHDLPAKPALLVFGIIAVLIGLAYYSSVSSAIIVCRLLGLPEDGTVEELTRHLAIRQHLDKQPGQLSTGERQRVAIGRALAHRPSIVIADEPTASLDPIAAEKIMALLIHLVEEMHITVIVASHAWRHVNKLGLRQLSHRTHRSDGGKVTETIVTG